MKGLKFPAIVLLMGAALVVSAHVLGPYFASDRGFALHVAALAGLIAAGLAVYALAVVATGAIKLRQLRKLIRRG